MSGIFAGLFGRVSPTYISRAANQQTVGASVGPAAAASDAVAGDMLVTIAAAENPSGVTWTDAIGSPTYTERLDQGAQPNLRIATRTEGGSDAAPGATASASADTVLTFYQLRFRAGVYDTIGSIATTTSNGTLGINGITSAGGLVLAIVVAKSAVTASTPSGWTQIVNETTQGMRVAIFSKVVPPGATGTVDTTIGSIDGTAAGILLGLK